MFYEKESNNSSSNYSFMILLVPIPFKLRDGGTVEWKSLTYSIANVHSIYAVGNESNKYELDIKKE